MDPQEIKNILKNARDALKNKQYIEAMKLCRVQPCYKSSLLFNNNFFL